MHGPLLERALRRSHMASAPVADVAIEVRHAAFVEAVDCFAAMIPAPVRDHKTARMLASAAGASASPGSSDGWMWLDMHLVSHVKLRL